MSLARPAMAEWVAVRGSGKGTRPKRATAQAAPSAAAAARRPSSDPALAAPSPVALPASPPCAASAARLSPRIRVLVGDQIALGPGKAALLAAVERRGSLAEAALDLGMSYMRAWRLVQTMNACFREPLVATRRGGKVHGGAALTATGAEVLALYRRMEQDGMRAMAACWQELRGHLA
jgi:molybdate transport system regulatory protein